MPVSADIFVVEDLDPVQLAADLVMIEDSLDHIDLGIRAAQDDHTRNRLGDRRLKEVERQTLTKELLRRRREYDRR